MAIAGTMQFLSLLNFLIDLAGKKLYTYKQKYSVANGKRFELVKLGNRNVDHFVHHHNNTVVPQLVQLNPEGHSHLFGLNAPN